MKKTALFLLTLAMAIPAWAQFQPLSQGDYYKAFDARRDSIIRYYADQIPDNDLTRGGYYQIAAKAYLNRGWDWQQARLDTLMKSPSGDMFWMYPITLVMNNGLDGYSPEVQARLKDLWRTYRPYRGDTENHWVLYYSTLYLAAERWPDMDGSQWFNGKSSKENRDDALGFLENWMELATTVGQGEYDSPHYFKVYVAPMALLYGYAKDPQVRQRAEMMLDFLIADYAVENLYGLYGGATARTYEREAVEPFNTSAADMGWLLFGNPKAKWWGETLILAMTGYRPPYILYLIGNDRSEPYWHRELKRTRHRFRHSDVKNQPVYKGTYMTSDYVMGFSQGGLLQPIQQMTWRIIWKEDDPAGIANTLFTVQPYSEPKEGTMYFAEPTDQVNELIIRSKTEYGRADKWTGGSDYEQVFQQDDALVALYDVPKGTEHNLVSGFFSKNLDETVEDASGWIFARAGGTYMAVYPIMKYTWKDDNEKARRLSAPAGKAGFVVQAAQASEFDSFEAFKTKIRSLLLTHSLEPRPTVTFLSLRGKKIEATYGQTPKVDGQTVNFDAWPLYESKFLEAAKGSRKLLMKYDNLRLELDFNTNTIREWVTPGN